MTQEEITNWEDLPLITSTIEYKDGWSRSVKKQGSISDLLALWDIDNTEKEEEFSQVLVLLRTYFNKYTELVTALKSHKII